jgi:hypothetical protein
LSDAVSRTNEEIGSQYVLELSKLSKKELLLKCEEMGILRCNSKTKSKIIELIFNKNVDNNVNFLLKNSDSESDSKNKRSKVEGEVEGGAAASSYLDTTESSSLESSSSDDDEVGGDGGGKDGGDGDSESSDSGGAETPQIAGE